MADKLLHVTLYLFWIMELSENIMQMFQCVSCVFYYIYKLNYVIFYILQYLNAPRKSTF